MWNESSAGDGHTHVAIHVHDDGVGIEPSRILTSFDPFETTRAADGAAGLGLAIARRIVEGAGGGLKVLSEVGRGTEMIIELPGVRS